MSTPSERAELQLYHSVTTAIFRAVVAYTSFGFVSLAERALHFGVLATIDPSTSPEQAGVVDRLGMSISEGFVATPTAAGWVVPFCAIALFAVSAKVGLVVHALRNRFRPFAHGWVPVLVAVLGIAASVASYSGALWFTVRTAQVLPIEAIAGSAIAQSIAATIHSGGMLVATVALVVYLGAQLARGSSPPSASGPYREPAEPEVHSASN